jgi:acetyltransferase-like isoleucine patch superfamily enzyme
VKRGTIGTGVIIRCEVIIGERDIAGAGAVVKKDVPVRTFAVNLQQNPVRFSLRRLSAWPSS